MPALRSNPLIADDKDPARVSYFRSLVQSQDNVLLARDREIEGHIRMLAGDQWSRWNPRLGRYINIADWFKGDVLNEASRRSQPIINRLIQWYAVTHARLTQNMTKIRWQPGPDQADAELRDVLNELFRIQWASANMVDVFDRLYSWLIPAGQAFLQSRIDPTKGPFQPWRAGAHVPVFGPDGYPIIDQGTGAPMMTYAPNVPLAKDYTPLAYMQTRDGLDGQLEHTGLQQVGEPHAEHEGQMAVDVLSPFACRGAWGDTPWQEKPWHAKLGYYTVEQCENLFGVDVSDTDATFAPGGAFGSAANIMERAIFGRGYYGAANPGLNNLDSGGSVDEEARGKQIMVIEVWCAPNKRVDGMEDTPDNPGGRHIALTTNRVLFDRPREVRYPYVSPLSCYTFLRLPGRPSGTTMQDAMDPLQRAFNKGAAIVADHTNLNSNPIGLLDSTQGVDKKNWTNTPGRLVSYTPRGNGQDPVKYLAPPQLGQGPFDLMNMTEKAMLQIGSTQGTDGGAQTQNESGEVRRERRYDGDRYVGPTQRRAGEETGRMAETWLALFPLIYTQPRVLREAGEDNLACTLWVIPDLFKQGNVNAVPDLESNLPETKEERQDRYTELFKLNLLGDTPEEARENFFEAYGASIPERFRPGGVDAITARQENGAMMRGQACEVLPFYGHAVHIREHLAVMKRREYLRLPPNIRQLMEQHVQAHELAMNPPPGALPPGAPGEAPAGALPGTPPPGLLGPGAPQLALPPGQAMVPPEQAPDAAMVPA